MDTSVEHPLDVNNVLTLDSLCGPEPERHAKLLLADVYPMPTVDGVSNTDGYMMVTGRRCQGGELTAQYPSHGAGGLLMHYFLKALEGRAMEGGGGASGRLHEAVCVGSGVGRDTVH